MSARSPRGSMSGASSAEVAEDFAESLKDLRDNNRYEISNLTIIAKENTEHALAISRALESHIKTTAPIRKLPALYVMDSIVKNVGPPYTTYLGANLYSTFMEAYTLVDGQTRRSMEGVLKTWKEPLPGSIDRTPVFPPEAVRPIENALIKARTAALQNRGHVPQPAFRNTPTPPQNPLVQVQGIQPQYAHSTPQVTRSISHYMDPTNVPQPFAGHPQFQPTPTPQQQPYGYQPPPQSSNDVEPIKRDLANLVATAKNQFSTNPFDQGLQKRLGALLQLQDILNRQVLSDVELQTVRNQLSAMSVGSSSLPAARPTPPPSSYQTSQWQPPAAHATPVQPPHLLAPPQLYSQPPSTQPPAAVPLLPPGALSSLQTLLANNQNPGTPQMRAAAPALQNASHAQLQNVQAQTAAAPVVNGAELIAALTKNGLVPPIPIPPPSAGPSAAPPPPSAAGPLSTADLLRSLQGKLPPLPQTSTPPTSRNPAAPGLGLPIPSATPAIPTTKLRLSLTSTSSLKTFHPSLVHGLYEAQPNQCSTCGRRFPATDAGRTHKQRHLDWHFRTNQRAAEMPRTGTQHRLWFVDELAWVQHVDFDVSTTTAEEAASIAASAAAGGVGGGGGGEGGLRRRGAGGPETETVLAPPGVTKNTCAICFEDMKAAFDESKQAWVFHDATRRGGAGAIVHATCLAELQKGKGGGNAGPTALLSSSSSAAPTTTGLSSLAAILATVNANAAQKRRSATPESTLGKRKAEGVLAGAGAGARVKME